MELRQGTQQVVRVGVLIAKQGKLTDPLVPVIGAQLGWYFWRYIVIPDGTVIDIVNYAWSDIPNCAGCYYLTLSAIDTAYLGPLTLYLFDGSSLDKPIFETFEVIDRNVWDSKYGGSLMKVEQFALEG